jgi:AcrR family transcriptional regulator
VGASAKQRDPGEPTARERRSGGGERIGREGPSGGGERVARGDRGARGDMRGHAREALLAAAQRALAERGFAGTSARVVAAQSGANLRSIAYHYGSLDDLLLTALSANFRTWMAPLIEALGGDGDARARVDEGLRLFADELPQRAGLVAAWLEAVARSRRDEPLRRRLAENQATFRDRLAATLEEAGVARPHELAAALIVACDGIMVRFLLHGDAPHPADLAADLAALA